MKLTDEQRWHEIAPLYARPRKIHSTYSVELQQDITEMKRS